MQGLHAKKYRNINSISSVLASFRSQKKLEPDLAWVDSRLFHMGVPPQLAFNLAYLLSLTAQKSLRSKGKGKNG